MEEDKQFFWSKTIWYSKYHKFDFLRKKNLEQQWEIYSASEITTKFQLAQANL